MVRRQVLQIDILNPDLVAAAEELAGHQKLALEEEVERLMKAREVEEAHLKTVAEEEGGHLKTVEEEEGEHLKRAKGVEEAHSFSAMGEAKERWLEVEVEEVVHLIVVTGEVLEDHCLSREVEEQAVRRREVTEAQMVSWEAKEVEVHSLGEQHENVL